eukprot:8716592-Ditylum_brightwellii.AAC.1
MDLQHLYLVGNITCSTRFEQENIPQDMLRKIKGVHDVYYVGVPIAIAGDLHQLHPCAYHYTRTPILSAGMDLSIVENTWQNKNGERKEKRSKAPTKDGLAMGMSNYQQMVKYVMHVQITKSAMQSAHRYFKSLNAQAEKGKTKYLNKT